MDYKANLDLWLNSSLPQEVKDEIKNMDKKERWDSFYTHIAFGTAGVRGVRGYGTNRINIYNIRMYSLAYGKYLLENTNAKDVGVAIAYDNRHMSKDFSYESAKVFGALGIKTYFFREERPTPQLSWVIRQMNLAGGLVLTASHNPPEYNGYKIYDDTGCQIAQEKFEIFDKHLKEIGINFEVNTLSIEELKEKKLLEYLEDDIDHEYIKQVAVIQLNPIKEQKIRIAYSSQHGAACVVTKKLYESLNLKLDVVKEQESVDPDFTNAPFPNPEDDRAYDMLKVLGKKIKADIIMSTDPDGDRFGCGILHNGEYQLINGNQSAALLLDYIISNKKEKGILKPNSYAIFTNVTSTLGRLVCEKYGVKMLETLTGFKWIGSVYNKELDKGNDGFIAGYEESYGFLLSDVGRDKDSLQAALMFTEMTQYYKEKRITLIDKLNEIYQEHGFHKEFTHSIVLEGSEGMEKIQSVIKHFKEALPKTIIDGKVIKYIDYSKQTIFKKDSKEKINLPVHPAFKLFFSKKDWIVLRPSGTEPKLKIYYCLSGKTPKERDALYEDVKSYIENILSKFGI